MSSKKIDTKLNYARQTAHSMQLTWLLRNNFDVYILNQNYQDCHYEAAGVTYIGDNSSYRPVDARNILFKHFEQTDDDYALFLDNDTILDEVSDLEIIKNFDQAIPTLLENKIGLMTVIDPIRTPRGALNKEELDQYFLLKTSPFKWKESAFIMLNWKKHADVELQINYSYLENERNTEQTMATGESILMSEWCYANGWKAAQINNIIQDELVTTSSWAHKAGDYKENNQALKEAYDRLEWVYTDRSISSKFIAVGYTVAKSTGTVKVRLMGSRDRIKFMEAKAWKEMFDFHMWELPEPMSKNDVNDWIKENLSDHYVMKHYNFSNSKNYLSRENKIDPVKIQIKNVVKA